MDSMPLFPSFTIATIIILLLLFLNLTVGRGATDIRRSFAGVTYHTNNRIHLPPEQILPAIQRANITRIRLTDPDIWSIGAFAGTGIDLNLSIEDLDLFRSFAVNSSAAHAWIADNVVPFSHNVSISSISVGYGILTRFPGLYNKILPAVSNVFNACSAHGLSVEVSTAHSFDIMSTIFPPSQAMFEPTYLPYLTELLDMDAKTNSSFQIELYPCHVYESGKIEGLTISFIMFESRWDESLLDPGTKLKYQNIYEIMVDGVVGALARIGHASLPIIVVGTGWPNSGDRSKLPEATQLYAAEYNERLVSRLNKGTPTPLRNPPPVTYIRELFDEEVSNDPHSFDNNWGIMTDNLTLKYHISFTSFAGDDHDDMASGAPERSHGTPVALALATASFILLGICNLI